MVGNERTAGTVYDWETTPQGGIVSHMLVERWPVTERKILIRSYRPGSSGDSEGVFRTLRTHGWVTGGVQLTVRSGPRIASRYQLFSSLNVDSTRAARRGRQALSRELAIAGESVERGELATSLVALLQHLPRCVVEEFLGGHMPPQEDYPQLWSLTELLAEETATQRDRVTRDYAAPPGDPDVRKFQELPQLVHETVIESGDGSLVVQVAEETDTGQVITDRFPGVRLPGVARLPYSPYRRTLEPLLLPEGALDALTPVRFASHVAVEIID